MKTYRVTFSAPKKMFLITYDLDASIEDYEFWGQKWSTKEYTIKNAKAVIDIPQSWAMIDSNIDAQDMATGYSDYGDFIADVPHEPVGGDTMDEFLNNLCDMIPAEWQIVEAWMPGEEQ
jgi:hypothetical protein